MTDKTKILEDDVAEPIEQVIARAELEAESVEHLSFIVSLHDEQGQEFYRQRVRFVGSDGRFTSAERVDALCVPVEKDRMQLWLRDALSGVRLVSMHLKTPLVGALDMITFDVGQITADFSNLSKE